MSRPKPEIILEYKSSDYTKTEQILKGEYIYAVYYKDSPINLRTLTDTDSLIEFGPKYKKTSFTNPGHAFNLAERLNKLFKTIDFSVYKLNNGEKITEDSKSN